VIAVRAPRPGDGAAIADILLDSARYYVELAPDDFRIPDEDGLVEFCEPRADRAEGTLSIVAEVDGELVGLLEAFLEPPDDSARFQMLPDHARTRLFINLLAVHSRAWRRGVGRALVDAAESWARERGATVSRLETYLGSPVSLPFWEDVGYRRRSVKLFKRLAD
jgi:GNAT superfamily N-acetyltransferase